MAKINNIIEPRNFEQIRDQLASIIVVELANQVTLQADNSIDATVYAERSIPFDSTELPAINVMLSNGDYNSQSAVQKNGTYKYFADVYCRAAANDDDSGDTIASKLLHKLCGIVDAIIMDQEYIRLDFAAPSISHREVTSIKFADPTRNDDGNHVMMGRLEITVVVVETTRKLTGSLCDGVDTQVKINNTEKGYKFTLNTDIYG